MPAVAEKPDGSLTLITLGERRTLSRPSCDRQFHVHTLLLSCNYSRCFIAVAILSDALSRARLDAEQREAQQHHVIGQYLSEHDRWLRQLFTVLNCNESQCAATDHIESSCDHVRHLLSSVSKAYAVAVNRVKSIGGNLSKSSAKVNE